MHQTNRSKQRWVGLGFRWPLAEWIATRPREVGCLEITAEHFFDCDERRLRALARDYPLFVHGLGLSLGTPGPLDRETLENFVRVAEITDPEWVSEHVAFTRTDEVDLGHLNPVMPTRETLDVVAEHVLQVKARCAKPMIVENITSHLRLDGELSETEFLNRLCEMADCGILLDVTNLYINSKNHGFDPRDWLQQLDPQRIVQLHVVGYSIRNGQWEDLHAEPIQDDLQALIHEVLAYAPVRSILIERDQDFPPPAKLAGELRQLESALAKYGPDISARTSSV